MLADELFDLRGKLENKEDEVYQAIKGLFLSEETLQDFTYDYYDRSIELYGVAGICSTPELLSKLAGMGFQLVWIHSHRQQRELCKCPCQRTS